MFFNKNLKPWQFFIKYILYIYKGKITMSVNKPELLNIVSNNPNVTAQQTSTNNNSQAQSTTGQSEDEYMSLDLSSMGIEELGALLEQNQKSQEELLKEQYELTIAQIQMELEEARRERNSLNQEIQSAALSEEGVDSNNAFSQISEINSKINKLNTELLNTVTQFQIDMQKLAIQAQQSALELQSLTAGASSTGGLTTTNTNSTTTSGKITSNLDGSTAQIDALIEKYANEAGLDPNFVKAVVKAESSFNPNATSSCGAQGLMQLMPSTAASLGVTDAYDPEQNIKGGVKYLKQMYEKFGSYDLALAAYNAGPGAVQKYGGIPPYSETQNYVKKINQYWNEYKNA